MNLTGKPLAHRLRKSFGAKPFKLSDVASDSWQIAPSEVSCESRTFLLPGQFDRVQQFSPFSESPEFERASLLGGQEIVHAATTAYVLRDVMLIDGGLYKGAVAQHLHSRTRFPFFSSLTEVADRHALFCTFGGNMYFGNWLMDDCVTYALARSCGVPTRTKRPMLTDHMSQYSNILDMDAVHLDNRLFKELVVFEDLAQNQNKKLRAIAVSKKLTAHLDIKPHAGVFLLRGSTGSSRILENEQELAQHLNHKFGLKVLDVTKLSVMEITAACAGAQMVVGVEGSHLLHGILHLAPSGSLLVLQPPKRYSTLLKGLTERDGQQFGIVVGTPGLHPDSFSMDRDEVDRTIALMRDA